MRAQSAELGSDPPKVGPRTSYSVWPPGAPPGECWRWSGGLGTELVSAPQPSGGGAALGGEDLSRDVRYRTHDEAGARAHGMQAPPLALVRVDELRVSTGRTEDPGRAGIAGGGEGREVRRHSATVSHLGEGVHRPKGGSPSVQGPRCSAGLNLASLDHGEEPRARAFAEQARAVLAVDELGVPAPRARGRKARIQVDPSNQRQVRLRVHGAPNVGHAVDNGIGSSGRFRVGRTTYPDGPFAAGRPSLGRRAGPARISRLRTCAAPRSKRRR